MCFNRNMLTYAYRCKYKNKIYGIGLNAILGTSLSDWIDGILFLKELIFKEVGFFMKYTQARQPTRFNIYEN